MPNGNDVTLTARKEVLHEIARVRAAIYLLDDDPADHDAQRIELQHRIERLRVAVEGRDILAVRVVDVIFVELTRALEGRHDGRAPSR